jgi:hypothetical protein
MRATSAARRRFRVRSFPRRSPAASPCQIAESTWHRWVAQYGDMKANDAKRLKDLKAENAQLKRLVAQAELDGRWSAPWPDGRPALSMETGSPRRFGQLIALGMFRDDSGIRSDCPPRAPVLGLTGEVSERLRYRASVFRTRPAGARVAARTAGEPPAAPERFAGAEDGEVNVVGTVGQEHAAGGAVWAVGSRSISRSQVSLQVPIGGNARRWRGWNRRRVLDVRPSFCDRGASEPIFRRRASGAESLTSHSSANACSCLWATGCR